jgi:hypothetical protein
MKKTKMSLANIQGKLSKDEMKKIMAGSGHSLCGQWCESEYDCRWMGTSCGKCESGPSGGMRTCRQ